MTTKLHSEGDLPLITSDMKLNGSPRFNVSLLAWLQKNIWAMLKWVFVAKVDIDYSSINVKNKFKRPGWNFFYPMPSTVQKSVHNGVLNVQHPRVFFQAWCCSFLRVMNYSSVLWFQNHFHNLPYQVPNVVNSLKFQILKKSQNLRNSILDQPLQFDEQLRYHPPMISDRVETIPWHTWA